MTRLLAVACACALAANGLAAATVSGKVAFVTKRGQHPVAAETVISLEPVGGAKVQRRLPGTFQMSTRGKMLLPHVMIVPVGSTVTFPNDDPISHNLFSLSTGNDFDLGLYRAGAGKSHTFTTPGLVNVYCNVHPTMSAAIHVMSTPYFGLADANGAFSLADVQPGRYDVVAWNELSGSTRLGNIDVPAAGVANLALTLDSTGNRSSGHLNKLGKPYTPPPSRDY